MKFWLARRIYDVGFFICRVSLRIQGSSMEEFQEYWRAKEAYNINLVLKEVGEE